jgi:hypothetical protein
MRQIFFTLLSLNPEAVRNYELQSKSSRNSSTSTVWCTMSPYRLDRVLLVIPTCKFCRGSGATSGRQRQWFLHHDNAPSHTSLVVKKFFAEKNVVMTKLPYSPDPPSSDLWLFSTLKMGWEGHFSQPWRTSNRMRPPNLEDSKRSLPPVLPTMVRSMEQVRVRARKDPTLKVIRSALPHILPLECNTTIPGTFWLHVV